MYKNVHKIGFFLLIIVLATVFIFAGCSFFEFSNSHKFDTPKGLSIIDDSLTWESVSSCYNYAIEFDYHDPEKPAGNTTSYYNYYSLIGVSACTIRVRALGDSYNTDSNWSKPVEYSGYVAPRIQHTITINYSGGMGDVTEITVILGEPFGGALPTAVWEGHTFTGWRVNTNSSGTTVTMVTEESMVTPDIMRLFATWDLKSCTLSFDLQGGTGTANAKLVYFGSLYGTLPTGITRPGYRFDGWQTEPDGGDKVTAQTRNNNNSDVTLYAIWTKYYTITFNPAPGSSGAYSVTPAVFNEPVPNYTNVNSTSRLWAPICPGYTFVGYFAEPNGAGRQYYALSGIYLVAMGTWDIESDTTLYAYYTAREYNITLDVQGGTGGNTQVHAVYDGLLPNASAPVRAGYTFDGYYTAINGGGTQYYDKDMVGKIWKETIPMLYAKWIGDEYRITCKMYDGTETEKTVVYGAAFTLSTTSRTGYNFTGWFENMGGAGIQYTNNTGASIKNYNVLGDITVYPGWTAQTYRVTLSTDDNAVSAPTVSFNLNGASGTPPASQKLSASVGLVYPPVPVRTGYMFAGWYYNPACTGTPFDFTAALPVNTVLYAKWIDLQYYEELLPSGTNIYRYNPGDPQQGTYYTYVPLVTQTVWVTWYTSSDFWYQRVGINEAGGKSLLSLQQANKTGGPNNPTSFDINVTAGVQIRIFIDLYGGANNNPNNLPNNVSFGINPMDTLPSAGGKAAPHKTVTATYDAAMPESNLVPPTRGGYTFGGYFTQPNGAGVQYYDQNMKSVRLWDIAVYTTLYAYWIPL